MPLLPCLQPGRIECGCDEAGRGCLAGPVYAAAVILPDGFSHPDLNDSKQLNAKKRNALRIVIEREAVCWGIGIVSPAEIDAINILNASFLAMHRAIGQLTVQPDHLLIDGNRFNPYPDIPHTTIVKGDARLFSIAAASILAKTARDTYMEQLSEQFPEYGWKSNRGYPTADHREAIRRHGATIHHRHSFTLLPPEQLAFDFGT